MTGDYSTKTRDLLQRLGAFFEQHIYPNEERYLREVDANRRAGNAWVPSRVIDELKPIARREGLKAALAWRDARFPGRAG